MVWVWGLRDLTCERPMQISKWAEEVLSDPRDKSQVRIYACSFAES